MFVNGTELIGLIGVYVDDFLVLNVTTIPSSQEYFNGERGMRLISR